jgi:putative peptidoglycan lipid II flippase
VLAAFSLGLPAFILAKVLAPGFFARGDTATPVKIAAISAAANLILALLLMIPFRAIGIALAATISAWLNAALLFGSLARRGFEPDARLKTRSLRIVLASAGMLAVIAVLAEILLPRLSGSAMLRAAGLGALVASGLLAFAGLAEALGAARFAELRQAMTKAPVSAPAGEPGA